MKIPSHFISKYPFVLVAGLGGFVNMIHLAPAQSWSASGAPPGPWTSVACSSNATKLVAVGITRQCPYGCYFSPFPIFTSSDSGATWVQTSAPSNYWSSVACSADGSHLVAVAMRLYGNELSGAIYTS